MTTHNTREWEDEFDAKWKASTWYHAEIKTFIHQELQKAREESYKAGQSDLIYKLGVAFPDGALEHINDVINEANEIAKQLQNQSELDLTSVTGE